MSQDSIFGFSIPVPLALALAVALVVLLAVLLAVGSVLAAMSAPARVRNPGCVMQGEAEREGAAWRF